MVRLYKDPEGENMFTTQRSSQEKATTVVVEVDLAAQNKKLEQRVIELETVLSQSLNQKQVIGCPASFGRRTKLGSLGTRLSNWHSNGAFVLVM